LVSEKHKKRIDREEVFSIVSMFGSIENYEEI